MVMSITVEPTSAPTPTSKLVWALAPMPEKSTIAPSHRAQDRQDNSSHKLGVGRKHE